MKKTGIPNNKRLEEQVSRVRKLYSQIGEPLPADVIIEMYHYLEKALELADEEESRRVVERKRVAALRN